MKKIKWAVIGLFAIAFAAFEFSTSGIVAGQAGGTSLSSPTGVRATDNTYNNKVGISWDTIRGATLYRVFRNAVNDPAAAEPIAATPSNSFFDLLATPGETFFYWVRAENGAAISEFSVPDQGTRAVAQQQGPVPPLAPPPVPPGNQVTATKVYLGKTLFWDEQMSSTRTVSCGTCHHSGNGGTDPRSVPLASASLNPGPDGSINTPDDIRGSAGVPVNSVDGTYSFAPTYGMNAQVTGRKTMSYVDAGYSPILFWDGRATGEFRDPLTNNVVLNAGAALESQVLGPPLSTAEMAHGGRNWSDVAARMASSKPLALSPSVPAALSTWINGRTYPELFDEAFGSPDVTPSRIALAIATFERTLYSDQTPLDLANAGITPLTPQEQRGRGVFNSSACNNCHAGNLLTDNAFHYIGVRPTEEDTGRFQVTGAPQNLGQFRTPSLRNVELRGSYFHNGRFTTLEEVVEFYDRGGDFDAPNKDDFIRPLFLSPQQKADLIAFLKRPLTDPRVAAETAQFDRPLLYTESDRVPVITGSARAGAGSFVPEIKAISPPIVGNPNFTISVSKALGNASGMLIVDEVDPGLPTVMPTTGSFAQSPVTTQNTGVGNGWASVSLAIPDNAELIGKTLYARWYVYDPQAESGFSVSQAARFTIFGEASTAANAAFVDFDGDGKTDVSVYRPEEGNWYILNSSNNTFTGLHFGIATDKLAPADYDGDAKTDIAVFRDGIWYLSRSRDGFDVRQFGLAGDVAQPNDYDGDGIADLAVYRPADGTWYIQQSRDGFVALQFGTASDRTVAADYDGDGKADPAVYRDGTWYVLKSTGGVTVTQYGTGEDKPVVGDYDGDGKSDIAVWRPSTGVWYRRLSSNNTDQITAFGLGADVPSPGDYDGDGSSDLSVYRPSAGTWFMTNSTGGEQAVVFGISTDRPVPSYIVP